MRHGVRREVSEQELNSIADAELRYLVTIAWSEQDQVYIARVPDLPGCAADGPTYEQAAIEIREAMRLWLWAAKDRGEIVPQPSRAFAAASSALA